MSEFKVKISNMKAAVEQQNDIVRQLKDLKNEIQQVQSGLSFEIAQKERIRQRLKTAQNDIIKEYNGISKAAKTLDNIANVYETTEAKLAGVEVPKESIMTNINAVLPYGYSAYDNYSSTDHNLKFNYYVLSGISYINNDIITNLQSKLEPIIPTEKKTWYTRNKKNLEASKINPFKVVSLKRTWDNSLLHIEPNEYKDPNNSIDFSLDIFKTQANSEIYGGLYYIDENTGEKKLRAAAGINIGATASILTSEQKKELGSSFLGSYWTIQETIGRVGASVSGVVGLRDADGNFNPTAHANLRTEMIGAEISAKGGVKVLGANVGASGAVNIGAGAHAEFGFKDGIFSADVGASLGIGGSEKLDIDLSGTPDALVGIAKAIWQSE